MYMAVPWSTLWMAAPQFGLVWSVGDGDHWVFLSILFCFLRAFWGVCLPRFLSSSVLFLSPVYIFLLLVFINVIVWKVWTLCQKRLWWLTCLFVFHLIDGWIYWFILFKILNLLYVLAFSKCMYILYLLCVCVYIFMFLLGGALFRALKPWQLDFRSWFMWLWLQNMEEWVLLKL